MHNALIWNNQCLYLEVYKHITSSTSCLCLKFINDGVVTLLAMLFWYSIVCGMEKTKTNKDKVRTEPNRSAIAEWKKVIEMSKKRVSRKKENLTKYREKLIVVSNEICSCNERKVDSYRRTCFGGTTVQIFATECVFRIKKSFAHKSGYTSFL